MHRWRAHLQISPKHLPTRLLRGAKHHQSLTQQVDAAAAALRTTAAAHKNAGHEIATAAENYQVETAQLDAARSIAIVRAEAVFDRNVALHWATLLESLEQLDVDYARALATAEVAHHLAVAEHAAQQLIALAGPRPDQSQQFAIRVANARTAFFRNVSEDYIQAVTSTARQSAEVEHRTARADAERQSARGNATLAFVTTTQNAWAGCCRRCCCVRRRSCSTSLSNQSE